MYCSCMHLVHKDNIIQYDKFWRSIFTPETLYFPTSTTMALFIYVLLTYHIEVIYDIIAHVMWRPTLRNYFQK